MDANRYFTEMHRAMAAQMADAQPLLTAKVQDPAGEDAYLVMARSALGHGYRVWYSTMGRQGLNFHLFRKGWQLCHNAAGELTGRFPARAESLIDGADFHAFIRSDALDAARAGRILCELERCAGTCCEGAMPCAARAGAYITVDSAVGAGAHWAYWSGDSSRCRTAAAILYWLAEVLAGGERQRLQGDVQAAHLAAQWQSQIDQAAQNAAYRTGRTGGAGVAARSAQAPRPTQAARPVQNERWRSILAVLNTV